MVALQVPINIIHLLGILNLLVIDLMGSTQLLCVVCGIYSTSCTLQHNEVLQLEKMVLTMQKSKQTTRVMLNVDAQDVSRDSPSCNLHFDDSNW